MSMLKIGSAETHRVAALPLHMQQKGPPGKTRFCSTSFRSSPILPPA